jgi:hypothetical protein
MGRRTNFPPQFGQRPPSRPSAQARQNVHSNEQTSRPQHRRAGHDRSIHSRVEAGARRLLVGRPRGDGSRGTPAPRTARDGSRGARAVPRPPRRRSGEVTAACGPVSLAAPSRTRLGSVAKLKHAQGPRRATVSGPTIGVDTDISERVRLSLTRLLESPMLDPTTQRLGWAPPERSASMGCRRCDARLATTGGCSSRPGRPFRPIARAGSALVDDAPPPYVRDDRKAYASLSSPRSRTGRLAIDNLWGKCCRTRCRCGTSSIGIRVYPEDGDSLRPTRRRTPPSGPAGIS